MTIQKILEARGYPSNKIEEILTERDFDDPVFINSKEGLDIIINSLLSDKNICVFYDCDVDGIVAGTLMSRFIEALGKKPKRYINKGKVHGITEGLIEYCKQNNVGLLICVDSSTNNTKEIEELVNNGTKVLIIDHHEIEPATDTTPNKDVVIINTHSGTLNNIDEAEYISAAAATYYFIEYINKQLGKRVYQPQKDLAYSTIITDFCILDNPFNRFILRELYKIDKYSPILEHMVYDRLDYSTIGFSYAPLVNACIRTNNPEVAIMLHELSGIRLSKYIDKAKHYKNIQKQAVEKILRLMEPSIITIGDSISLLEIPIRKDDSILWNLTGLLASKVQSITGKSALVYSKKENGQIRGSFRGRLNIDYKTIFTKNGLLALGHHNAFGVIAEEKDLETAIAKIADDIASSSNVHIKDYDIEETPTGLLLLEDMLEEYAKFNEFAGSGLDKIRIKLNIPNRLAQIWSNENYYVIRANGIHILSFDMPNLSDLIVIPTLGGRFERYKLIAV